MSPKRVGELDLDEDLRFERRSWVAERVAWVVFAALVAAALLGLFGEGPLSTSEARSPDGSVVVAFERFARRGGATDVFVQVDPRLNSEEGFEIVFSDEFLDSFTVRDIQPQPDATRSLDEGLSFSFLSGPGDAMRRVRFSLNTDSMGSIGYDIRVADQTLSINHFIYP